MIWNWNCYFWAIFFINSQSENTLDRMRSRPHFNCWIFITLQLRNTFHLCCIVSSRRIYKIHATKEPIKSKLFDMGPLIYKYILIDSQLILLQVFKFLCTRVLLQSKYLFWLGCLTTGDFDTSFLLVNANTIYTILTLKKDSRKWLRWIRVVA